MALIGQTIDDRYLIQEIVYTGTLSVVYKAYDIEMARELVVKILDEEAASKRADDIFRFRRETAIVSSLSHPGLVKVFASGRYGHQYYIVMEMLPGMTLDRYIQTGGQLKPDEVMEIVWQLAEALRYVHSEGIIHRDLKPENIMVAETESGVKGNIAVKILDFGLAQIVEPAHVSHPAEIVGTFGYMSPEQSGMIQKPVDERTDLYSLGVIFYQLLTSEVPYTGDSVGAILHRQIATQPLPPRMLKDDIPEVVEQMVLKLLRKEPAERYQSAQGLLTDINKYLQNKGSFVLGQGDTGKRLNYRVRMIGREAELAKLKDLYSRALKNQGGICLLGGEAGGGKSRLVEEFKRWVYEQGGAFLWGNCLDQQNKIPYHPFAEVLKSYMSMIEKMDVRERQDRLARMKASPGILGEALVEMAPQMKDVLGEVPPAVALDPERDYARFLNVCAQFFMDIGTLGRPAVIVIDNLQWADEGSLTLLREMMQVIEGYPVMMIGVYRDDEIAPTHRLHELIQEAREWPGYLEEIKLDSFDLSGISRILSEILAEEEEDIRQLSQFVYQQSRGNPFFAIEIVRQMADEKALNLNEGRFVPDWEVIGATTIPSAVVDIILKKTRKMKPELLELLSLAAVIGREFDTDILIGLDKYTLDELIVLIDEAVALQLVEKGQGRGNYAFVHDRVREAFYQSLLPEKRQRLHFDIATVIEDMYREDPETVIFELAGHFTAAGDTDKTLKYSLPAAEKAKAGFANIEAERNYKIALEVLEKKQEKGSPLWQKAKEGLMEVYLITGDFAQSISIARELLPFQTSPVDTARLKRHMATAYFKTGDIPGSEKMIAQGLSLLGEHVPQTKAGVRFALARELLVHSLHTSFPSVFCFKEGQSIKIEHREILSYNFILGWTYALSDAEKFAWSVLRIMNITEAKIGDAQELARFKGAYGSLCMAIPMFGKAEESLKQAITMLEELQDEWGLAQRCQWLGFCYLWQGSHRQSISYFLRSRELFQRLGDSWEQIYSILGLGGAYRYLSDYTKSQLYFSECMALSRRIRSFNGVASAMSNFAWVCIQKGDFSAAAEWLEQALELSAEKDVKITECSARVNWGCLHLFKGEYEQAVNSLSMARDIYLQQKSLKDTTVRLFNYLADAHVEILKGFGPAQKAGLAGQKSEATHKACREALKQTRSWPNHHGGALTVNGKYYAQIGNYKKAEKYFRAGINHCQKLHLQDELAKGYLEYGMFLKEFNRPNEAEKFWLKAYNMFRKMGHNPYTVKLQGLLNIGQYPAQVTTVETFPGIEDIQNQSGDKLLEKLEIHSFKTISSYLDSVQNSDLLPEKILELAIELTGAERGCLLLYPEERSGQDRTLEVKLCRNMEQGELAAGEFNVSRAVIGRVEETMMPEIVYDAFSDYALSGEASVVMHELRSILCYPLVARGKMMGLIYLDNRQIGGLFNNDKLELLKPFFTQTALSLDNTRLYNRLKKAEKSQFSEIV